MSPARAPPTRTPSRRPRNSFSQASRGTLVPRRPPTTRRCYQPKMPRRADCVSWRNQASPPSPPRRPHHLHQKRPRSSRAREAAGSRATRRSAVRATTRLPALLPIARCGSSNPPRRTAARASRSTALSRRCRRLSAPSAAWRAGTSTRRTSSAVSSRTSGAGVPRPRGALTPRVRVTRTARAAPPQAVRARDELAPARGLPVRRGLSALRDRAVLDRSDRAPVRETPRHTARRAHSRGSPG